MRFLKLVYCQTNGYSYFAFEKFINFNFHNLLRSVQNMLLLILSFGFCLNSFGQDSLSKAIQFNVLNADILPHSEDIRLLSYSNPVGFSAAYIWQNSRSGNSYEYPLKSRKGFKFQYVNFNNTKQLGHALSLSAFTEPILGTNRKLFFSFPIEAGLINLNKVYHPINNPDNLFFSLPISFYLSAGIQTNFKLNKQLLLQSAFQYQHISNGGIKMPNKGMNFISYHLGLCYYLTEPNWQKSKLPKQSKETNKFNLEGYLIGTAKTITQTNELLPMAGIQVSAIKPLNYFHAVYFSTEGLYNSHKKAYEKNKGNVVSAWEQSLLMGYQLSIGATRFQVSFGYPVLSESSTSKNIYQRYMLVRTFAKRWLLAGSLKAEGHVADIFDVRLGYQLSR